MVAATLLLLIGTLGATEATGVTHLTATVIRIFRPEGTLEIVVDDPGVKVAIDGEDIGIQGAGPHEVHLRLGSHQVQALSHGKPVYQDLVTINRGGKQIVKIGVAPPAKTEAKAPSEPRVMLRYEVEPSVTPGNKPLDLAQLAATVYRRIAPEGNPQVMVHPQGNSAPLIFVPRSLVGRVERRLALSGTLEFRILANNKDHRVAIDRANAETAAAEKRIAPSPTRFGTNTRSCWLGGCRWKKVMRIVY